MMQTLKIETKVPDDFVILTKEEHSNLLESTYLPTGGMKWLCEATNIKTPDTLSRILKKAREDYPELEDFVQFPEEGNWIFVKRPMSQFIEENFHLFKKAARK